MYQPSHERFRVDDPAAELERLASQGPATLVTLSSGGLVASILPIWILARNFNLLNTRQALVILYTAINLPLAVWMLRSFFHEVPRELIEAAEIDGASLWGQLRSIILPIAAPGIAATALLCVIFAWNEFFYAVQLNPVHGSTVHLRGRVESFEALDEILGIVGDVRGVEDVTDDVEVEGV